MIGIELLLRIVCRRINVLLLHSSGRNVMFVHRHALLWPRLVANAVGSAVVRDVVVVDDRGIMHDRLIYVSVMNDGVIHMHDGRVVEEVATTPLAAGKAKAHVAEAIVHATVVADVRTPVTGMEEVNAAFKAPVWGRPKIARLGSWHPCARHPVVAVGTVSPVTRRPQITLFRAGWLLIDRQHRRCKVDADEHSSER